MDVRNNHGGCLSDPALRWLGRLVLGIVSLYLLTQVIGRVMRRVRPGLTPLRAIPSLKMPLRWKFFGTPERILDRAGISPGMQVLEIGPGQALARMWNERYPDVPARSCDEFRSAAGIANWVAGVVDDGRSG